MSGRLGPVDDERHLDAATANSIFLRADPDAQLRGPSMAGDGATSRYRSVIESEGDDHRVMYTVV